MDNTRDELLDLIRNATNIDMICFFAIIYVVAPDSPPYTPIATRGELKKAIKQLRSAQHMVRSEFLNTLKRLVNLDYENIILISHEDRSRDLTRKGGDKISSIKPNLQDKVANKVAGMVDLVARIVADDDERVLSFKTSEVIFGGGRLTVRDKEIPLTYDAFCEVYEEANQKAAGAVKRGGNTPATPAPETTDTPTTAPSRRGRKPKTETPPPG